MDVNDVQVNELSMAGQVMSELAAAAAAVSGMTEAESEQSHSAYPVVQLTFLFHHLQETSLQKYITFSDTFQGEFWTEKGVHLFLVYVAS